MSDTVTPGDRLDAAIASARQAAVELREQVGESVDVVSARIDEIQAAWEAHRNESEEQEMMEEPDPDDIADGSDDEGVPDDEKLSEEDE